MPNKRETLKVHLSFVSGLS